MKTKKLFILALLLMLVLGTTLVQAQVDLENDQEATEATDESTISNIKKVIQDKQLELGQEEQLENSKQAYIAQVKRVSAETLTLKNNKGSKIVPINDEVQIFKKQQAVEVDQLAVDNWVVVYGIIENEQFVTQRIDISNKDFTQDIRQVAIGSITEIYSNNLTLQPRSSEEKISVAIDKNSNFLDYNGDQAFLNDFYEDLQCIVVAKENDNGKLMLSTIKALARFD